MQLWVVYETNEDGTRRWINSYWLKHKNAVARFKEIWPYCREPDKSEINYNVKVIETED